MDPRSERNVPVPKYHDEHPFYGRDISQDSIAKFTQSAGEPRVAYNHAGYVFGPQTVGKRRINVEGGKAHPGMVIPKKTNTRPRTVLKRAVDHLPGPKKPRIG